LRTEADDAKIGLLVALTLALFLGFLFQRSLRAILRKEFHVQVLLANAADVAEGTEVQLQGLRVGQVEAVTMRLQGVEYRFLADLGLRSDIVLWEGTQAMVVAKPLGGSYVDLQLPPPAARTRALAQGTVLSGSTGPSLATLVDGIDHLVRNLDRSVTEVRESFEQKGAGVVLDHPQVAAVLANLQETLKGFTALARDSQGLVHQGGQTMAIMDRDLLSLEQTLGQVQKLVESRSGDLDQIVQHLAGTLKETEAVAKDLDVLLKQAGPDSHEVLQSLERNLKSTEELLELLKAKPNRIVWGTPSQAERDAAARKVQEARKPQ